jgi:hypothetical protein
MTVKVLRQHCNEFDLHQTGNKTMLIERLEEFSCEPDSWDRCTGIFARVAVTGSLLLARGSIQVPASPTRDLKQVGLQTMPSQDAPSSLHNAVHSWSAPLLARLPLTDPRTHVCQLKLQRCCHG